MGLTVAIDGPAGAGKSTVARRVAMLLGCTYIDSGAMYRALTWTALQQGVPMDDAGALTALAERIEIALSPLSEDRRQMVTVDDSDVTDAIRTPEVSQLTSAVSAFPAVRRVLVAHQKQMAQTAERGVVLDGRDIGTVVFPQAEVKVFLTATPEERARRRMREWQAKGMDADFAAVLAEIIERDTRDTTRADSPLRAADDAVTIATDDLTEGAVVARIIALCRERGATV